MNQHELATRAFVRKFVAPKRCGSWSRALEVLAEHMDSAGRIRITHARLGRAIALGERQTQTIVHALQSAGVLRIVAQRGYANVYRVLVDWVLRLMAGESTVARSDAAPAPVSEPYAGPANPSASSPDPPPPWIFARHLEAHPFL